jgi:PncC family amidohydrolase
MDEDTLEKVKKVHLLFVEKGLTLTVAESCTGGLINHLLTELPGASMFLEAGLVAYSVESKHRLLNVKRSLVKKYGIISEEAAQVMAQGAAELTDADVALAVTGNLGPDAWEGKEIGLVYAAVSFGDEMVSRGFLFDGLRGDIKKQAAMAALKFLREVVSGSSEN